MEYSIIGNIDERMEKNGVECSDAADIANEQGEAADDTKNPQGINYKIVVDSTADFTREMWKRLKKDVITVPLHLEPIGLEKLSLNKYYKYLREHKDDEIPVRTSSGTLHDAQSAIGQAFSQGYDVIYITMSRHLSQGSYRIAKIAAGNMRLKYQERKVTVLDSGCASTGLGLLVERLVEKRLSYDEAVDFVRNEAPKIIHIFTVDNFSSLIKGGRFDDASRSLAVRMLMWKPMQKLLQLMGIFAKIIIGFYDNNLGEKTMMPLKVKWGQRRLIKGFVREILRYLPEEPETTPDITIAHAGNGDLADKIYSALREQVPGTPGRIRLGRIGKVMGAHCGETATAVFFWGTRKLTKR